MRVDAIRKITKVITNRWSKWRSARAQAADLACCDAAEVGRIARDLGLPSDELKRLAGRDAGSADLLDQRLTSLGMETGTIRGELPDVLRDMQRSCSSCDAKRRCARDLERGTGSRIPAYCPNAETLSALTVISPSGRR